MVSHIYCMLCSSFTEILLQIYSSHKTKLQRIYGTTILSTEKTQLTFVDVPHDGSVVNRSRHHEISIPGPADVIHILYVSPTNK